MLGSILPVNYILSKLYVSDIPAVSLILLRHLFLLSLEPIHVKNNYSVNISVELPISCQFYCGYNYVKVWYQNLS